MNPAVPRGYQDGVACRIDNETSAYMTLDGQDM